MIDNFWYTFGLITVTTDKGVRILEITQALISLKGTNNCDYRLVKSS